ncbi:outer membrane beta-barrel protein [Wolbachia endosymbiont (group B) of Dolichovespula media]|uniref:outer membrane beta-barrel protein n=1 Tax=Wolbachia endosymbiont (group B) of Dolichovespula media TaxID=2954001 RepID=UPI0021F887E0|nr:outer membrane beta-barrel protein [Wolbachia endosymbiont (group B) of Dolichovespula media]
MKIKGLCVLAVLLTSSLAGAASNKAASNSAKEQYYAGLNFGGGWGTGLKIKPGLVFGYNYDKSSKFELEILTDVSDMFGGKDAEGKDKDKKMGASLLANYRYYPDVDIDPVKLYVSGGLGGYLQVIPFGSGKSEGNSNAAEAQDNTLDKVLGAISYKLKVGVDYEVAPQIVGTAALTVGGQLSGVKAMTVPDMMLEVGVRYNF